MCEDNEDGVKGKGESGVKKIRRKEELFKRSRGEQRAKGR